MSILDDAIREHLELKRQHGADDSELKQLEDDAFGPAERPSAEQALPDADSEAPTEFMTPPLETGEAGEERVESSRVPNIADLQEAPQQPPVAEPDSAEEPPPLAEEEHPAMEHETVPEPAAESVSAPEHSTEERHAISEQPTELFDVEGEIAASESRSPSDEELVEEEVLEPRLAPVDPLAGLEEVDEDDVSVEGRSKDAAMEADDEDDFFDEQRLSEELDQALEAPVPPVVGPGELEPLPEDEDNEDDGASGHFDQEEDSEEHALEPAEDDSEEHAVEEDSEEHDQPTGDVLGDTPDFLEEAPEDDQLWFEQKPPKDFDFDD
jgi:hypothetical protein